MIEAVAIVLLLVLSAALSASETAFFSLQIHDLDRLRASGRAGAAAAALIERPRRLLTTILLANTVVNIALAATMAQAMARLLGPGIVASTSALALGTLLVLVFGEVTPKAFAIRHNAALAVLLARPLGAVQCLLGGPIEALVALARRTPRIARFEAIETITEDELRAFVESRRGLDEDERRMIRSIFDLDRRRAGEICVPRDRIVALPKETSLRALRETIAARNVTRVPVVSGSIDNVIGVVYAKDLLPHLAAGEEVPIARLLRPVAYVPKWRRADDLLRELQRRKRHIAVVVNEFGATEGIVTLEDVVEEIVGEIEETRGRRRPPAEASP